VIDVPVPPVELARYVGHLESEDVLANYERAGHVLGEHLLRSLPADLELAGCRVLDFGCGPGRLLRHLVTRVPAGTAVDGCDIDEASIAWLRAHLPAPHEAFRSAAEPPLPRADGSYRLIYATSVFTHLAASWSAWLCELHRLLEPGGVLAATIMGRGCATLCGEDPWDEDRIGMLVLGPGRPWSAGGPMVLHSEWWLRAHWGRAFEVLSLEPTGFGMSGEDWPSQGLVVMRRRDGDTAPTASGLEAPGDDPREHASLVHALRRSQAESAELNAGHDRYALAYQSESRANGELRARLAAAEAEVARLTDELARRDQTAAPGRPRMSWRRRRSR
jgi:SAM-dependent methyltransferase